MAIYENNGIIFNNVPKQEESFEFEGSPFVVNGMHTESGDRITNIDFTYGGAINAVDIYWNGAKPGIGEDSTTGITTTGELLSRIKGVYSPMFAN